MKRFFSPAVCVVLAVSAPAGAGALHLTIERIRSGKDNTLIAVFDDAKAYEAIDFRSAKGFASVPAQPGLITHEFPELSDGPSAVLLIHDENGDEDLNFNGIQLLEGAGVSGARGRGDEPGFAQASVRPGNATVHVFYDGKP